jgi:hypothetical protein
MTEMLCEKKCCIARYCPLVVAYACTIHKFQGFEAGFDHGDTVSRIIADMSNLDWEKRQPGTAYVVTSRAKTIGTCTCDEPYPFNSNIYFDGSLGPYRFQKTLYKNNNEKCIHIQQRDAWVSLLNKKSAETMQSIDKSCLDTMRSKIDLFKSSHHITSKSDLQCRIMEFITNPNTEWQLRKQDYNITD